MPARQPFCFITLITRKKTASEKKLFSFSITTHFVYYDRRLMVSFSTHHRNSQKNRRIYYIITKKVAQCDPISGFRTLASVLYFCCRPIRAAWNRRRMRHLNRNLAHCETAEFNDHVYIDNEIQIDIARVINAIRGRDYGSPSFLCREKQLNRQDKRLRTMNTLFSPIKNSLAFRSR